jgi:hypothetical protein
MHQHGDDGAGRDPAEPDNEIGRYAATGHASSWQQSRQPLPTGERIV